MKYKIPLLKYLVHLIAEILTTEAPVAGQAAGMAALASVETDPKVQAITAAIPAVLAATQALKVAIDDHPDAPVITPAPAA